MSNIREFAERRGCGLKMADIARITGISESMLSLINSGKRNVTPNTAKRLAPTLGVNWWELID